LDKIGLAFVKVLSGILHSRVEYPELPPTKKEEIEKNKETKNEPDQDEAAKTKGEVSTPCPDSCLEDDDQSGSDNDSKDDCCTKDNQLGDNKN
ncbi:MAG: hypothetical protein GX353_09780, partial [Oligella ureolytica]|nr:hypothetical protein [Oligella ureolytica]